MRQPNTVCFGQRMFSGEELGEFVRRGKGTSTTNLSRRGRAFQGDMKTRLGQTAIAVITFVCIVAELRAQTAAPVNIPLQYWTGAEKLQIIVGINGGAPQPYIFDTGSPVFNAVYNPSWWPGFTANP